MDKYVAASSCYGTGLAVSGPRYLKVARLDARLQLCRRARFRKAPGLANDPLNVGLVQKTRKLSRATCV